MKKAESTDMDFQELGEAETESPSYQKDISGEQLESYIRSVFCVVVSHPEILSS